MKQITFLFSILFFQIVANAQILYFDIVPDVTVDASLSTYQCNMPKPDSLTTPNYFSLGYLTIWFHPAEITIASPMLRKVQVLTESTGTLALALNASQTIDSTGTWVDAAYTLLRNATTGYWDNVTDKYLGVRYPDSSNLWHYGWLRMDIDHNASHAIVKDRAVNSLGNAPINAGQTTTTGVNAALNENSIAVIAHNKQLRFTGIANNEKYHISLIDMRGILRKTFLYKANETIDLSAWMDGPYVIVLQGPNTINRFKIEL